MTCFSPLHLLYLATNEPNQPFNQWRTCMSSSSINLSNADQWTTELEEYQGQSNYWKFVKIMWKFSHNFSHPPTLKISQKQSNIVLQVQKLVFNPGTRNTRFRFLRTSTSIQYLFLTHWSTLSIAQHQLMEVIWHIRSNQLRPMIEARLIENFHIIFKVRA